MEDSPAEGLLTPMRLLRPISLGVASGGEHFSISRPIVQRRGWPGGWLSRPQKVEITEAAGSEPLDAEEQNNIGVYRKNIQSVVNITSRAVAFDFFYGLGAAGGARVWVHD